MATRPHTKDEVFNTKLLSIILYLFGTMVRNATPPAITPAVAARLNISTADMNSLWDLFYLWTDYYPRSQNPVTYQAIIKDKKNNTRTEFETLWRRVCGDMKKSALNDDDRIALYLPGRDTALTDVQPKEKAPWLMFEPSIHGMHVLRIFNPNTPDSKAMPKGQKVFIEKYVGEANLGEAQIPFGNVEIVSTHIYKASFAPADMGKTAYYRPCYITRTGKKGLKGVVISGLIS